MKIYLLSINNHTFKVNFDYNINSQKSTYYIPTDSRKLIHVIVNYTFLFFSTLQPKQKC